MNEEQKCKSTCADEICELPVGHRGKHRRGGVTWTDQGAERVNRERAAKQSLEVPDKA